MNKRSFIIGLALVGSGFLVNTVSAQYDVLTSEAQAKIEAVEKEIDVAKQFIEKGKKLIVLIPEDSPLMPEVTRVLQAASESWGIAVDSLKGSKGSASKIYGASNEAIAKDYALLSEVSAGVALSGAKVVQITLSYIEAIALNKTESLDLIKTAMQGALATSSQVQFSYERVKMLVVQKYSK